MASSVTSSASSSASASDPFVLIERGNAMESSGNLWSAADAFGRASVALRSSASSTMDEIAQIETDTSKDSSDPKMARKSVTQRAAIRNKKLGEKRKIAALFMEQSGVYLHRARQCLLQALTFETEEDEKRSKAMAEMDAMTGPLGRKLKVAMERAEPLVGLLPPREARRRREIFGRIYAGGEEEIVREISAKKEVVYTPDGSEARKGTAEKAEEKKDEAQDGTAAAAEADTDAEMEAALLEEEMDAEFGPTGIPPVAPGSDKPKKKGSAGEGAAAEDELDIPAAPSMPTLPKKGGDDDLVIPSAPDDGAGHIEPSHRKSSASAAAASPPQSPGAADADHGPLPPAAPTGQGAAGDPNSLEARLAAFDATVPSQLKSQDERMADIQKGLGRLGLSLPDSKSNSIAKVFKNHTEKSEEEQIKEIMEQAADEAMMEGSGADAAATAAAAAAGGIGGEDGDGAEDTLVINDTDDLNAVLSKAGLTTSELKNEVAKIEDVLGEDGKKALQDLKDGGKDVADRAKALSLIAQAQELLFEASAFLEDDEDVDEEEEEIMAAGEDDDEEEDGGNQKKKKKESDALRKGRAGLVGAQKCLEKAIKALPQ